MKKTIYIVSVAALMCACSAANNIPLDDAYIYSEKSTPTPVVATPTPTAPATTTTPAAPTMEIVNAQDTTITVRIKR